MKTVIEVQEFVKSIGQLIGMIDDFSELSKKKPDEPINKFKLRLVNSVLETINSIVAEIYRPFQDFQVFNEDDIPTNSDVLVILNQYRTCVNKYVKDNVDSDGIRNYWIINGKRSEISAHLSELLKEQR